MPIYEYKCQSCENELEKLQRLLGKEIKRINALIRV